MTDAPRTTTNMTSADWNQHQLAVTWEGASMGFNRLAALTKQVCPNPAPHPDVAGALLALLVNALDIPHGVPRADAVLFVRHQLDW